MSKEVILENLIPEFLLLNLSKRARNVLINEKIITFKKLFNFKEEILCDIANASKKTIQDIINFRDQIFLQYPHFVSSTIKHTSSPESQHNPIEKSILSKSLFELFNPLLNNCEINFFNNLKTMPVIGDLGFFDQDIKYLQKLGIYPQDLSENLFWLSLDYLLLTEISDDAFSVFLEHLAHEIGLPNKSLMKILAGNVNYQAILADLDISEVADFSIIDFTSCSDILPCIKQDNKIDLKSIAALSEYTIIDTLGFSLRTLKAIQWIWHLREQVVSLQIKLAKGFDREAYVDFEKLVNEYFESVIKKERDRIVLKGRLGLLDGNIWTLEELGTHAQISRERVRQIEMNKGGGLKALNALAMLSRLWCTVDDILKSYGGVCCANELAESLKKRWQWKKLPSEQAMASIINFSEKYEVVWSSPILIILPKHQCLNCTLICSELIQKVSNSTNGILPFDDAILKMQKFCRSKKCSFQHRIIQFSYGYLHYLDDLLEEISADEDKLYTSYAWALHYGKQRKTKRIEDVFLKVGREMHFTEACKEVNKDQPQYRQMAEHSVYGLIARSEDLLLWDRGTYIHRSYVTIPLEIIKIIEHELIRRLNDTKIPYVSVSGIFNIYKDSLSAAGVPSESALYSCLRVSNNLTLSCPDYPYVLKSENDGERQPLPLVLEEYIREQEKNISFKEIIDYAVNLFCVNEEVFRASHFQNIPNLIRVDHGEYIHTEQLSMQKDKLLQVVEQINRLLVNSDHVSVKKVFNDKKITCKLLGITNPVFLYSMLQHFYFEQYDLPRFPNIRRSNAKADENRYGGVSAEVINYIREKNAPCSFTELYKHFVERLGFEQVSVYSVCLNNSMLRYSGGTIVHLETIQWSSEKNDLLDTLATKHLCEREKIGEPYGLISHIHDFNYNLLPDLPDQISWTPTLLSELLLKTNNYRIIGTQRNAFVAVNNPYGIDGLSGLLYHILKINYDGAAQLNEFTMAMQTAGILQKKLTPMMLGEGGRVVIDNNVILLTDLAISGIPNGINYAISLSVMDESSFHNVRNRTGICSGIFTSPTVR